MKQLASRRPEAGIPAMLHGKPEATVLFNNLSTIPATTFKYPTEDEERAKLALEIDRVICAEAPANWKGDETREKQVINALYPWLARDREATQAIFDIIKNQPGYQ